MSIQVLCPPLNGVVFLIVEFGSSLYIPDINHLPDMWFTNTFSHSVGCLCALLLVSFDVQRFLKLMKYSLVSVVNVVCAFAVLFKIALPNLRSGSFSHMISSKNFMILALMVRSFIQFHLIFPYGVKIYFLVPFRLLPDPSFLRCVCHLARALESEHVALSPTSTICRLCHCEQVPQPLCASVSSSIKWECWSQYVPHVFFYEDSYTKSSQRVPSTWKRAQRGLVIITDLHGTALSLVLGHLDLWAVFDRNILLQGPMRKACARVVKMSPGSVSWLLTAGLPWKGSHLLAPSLKKDQLSPGRQPFCLLWAWMCSDFPQGSH